MIQKLCYTYKGFAAILLVTYVLDEPTPQPNMPDIIPGATLWYAQMHRQSTHVCMGSARTPPLPIAAPCSDSLVVRPPPSIENLLLKVPGAAPLAEPLMLLVLPLRAYAHAR